MINNIYSSAKLICHQFFIEHDMDKDEFIEQKDDWYEYWTETSRTTNPSLETIWFHSVCDVNHITHHNHSIEDIFFFGTLH
jgi:hypothetical protein